MRRRDFTRLGFAALCTPAFAGAASSQATFHSIKAFKTRMSSQDFDYSRRVIKDPTGTAPGTSVERFEVRGTDCPRRDECTKGRPLNGRLVTRNRSERILGYRLGEGDVGLFRYSVFLPSAEYTIVDTVGSTFGQLLWAFESNGNYESFPVCSLDTAWGTHGRVEMVMKEMIETEQERLGYYARDVGSLYRGLLDRWLDVEIEFGLSSGKNGYIAPRLNGRALGRFTGRLMLKNGWLEARYGIYQTGTNQFSGNPNQMPTQVAYFSNVGMFAAR